MHMRLICNSLLILVSLFLVQSLSAQRYGHVNSATLVENHPGIVTANAELETFRKSVSDPFETKTKSFQSRYQFFMEEMNAGTLSKVSAQTRQEELAKEQEALNTEGQQIQFSIMQKREQLLQPILANVDSLIQVVAKEGKYTMIFDNSVTGALLYAVPGDDLTEVIKTKIKGGK